MDINYELYKVFYQVADTLSFSEASRRLYISQSAVSQSIKTLEKKLGQPLFIRSTKQVRLTPAGELLFKHIEPAIRLIARGEEQLFDGTAPHLGQLHIGASDTVCRYFLLPHLKRFHEQYPSVPIRVTNATSLGCADLLEQGKVDCIISNYPNVRLNTMQIQKQLLSFQDVFVANPAFFPVTKEEIPLSQLCRWPILTLDKKSTTSDHLYRFFLQHNLELIPEIQLSSNDLLMDMAKIGLGIACVPDYCISDSDPDLAVIRLRETMPPRQLVAAAGTSMPKSPSTEAFLDLLPKMPS